MIIDKMFDCIFKQCESIIEKKRLCCIIDKERYNENDNSLIYFLKGESYDEWMFINDVYALANALAIRYREADICIKTSQFPDGDEYDEWYSANIIIRHLKK